MTNKQLIGYTLLVLVAIAAFGFLLPALISAQSTELVVIGIATIIFIGLSAVALVREFLGFKPSLKE